MTVDRPGVELLAELTLDSAQGPDVVAIGGGHGLARTLEAVVAYAGHTTAIVTVADDGGSSGRLSPALRIPPPGDIRRALRIYIGANVISLVLIAATAATLTIL